MVDFMKMSDVSNINDIQLQIMLFIHNALERGWSVKKVNGCSPNSAGCPVLAELTISAAEH